VWAVDQGNDRLQHFTSTGTYVESIALASTTLHGVGMASGDVLWASDFGNHTVSKWDELPGGYGQLAIDIDGNLGTYTGIGQIDGAVTNMATGTATASSVIRVFGKATADTAQFNGMVLSARAEAQR
jgi:sulfite exporter TauE/SafE